MRADGTVKGGLGLAALVAATLTAVAPGPRAEPAAPALAAPPLTVPRPDVPDAAARREANRARIRDARLEQLHAGLQLTPAQELLWPPIADAIRELAQARGRRFHEQLEAVGNPVDALEMQGDHMAKVGVAMGRLADATRPLVATLTTEQKSKLPALLQRTPLRKVVARAFGAPLDADRGAATAGAAAPVPNAAATPPSPKTEPDDDE